MEGTIRLYLETRLKKLGFSSFTFEAESVTVFNEVKEIKAFNEFYYLFDCTNDTDDFIIKADNDIMTASDFMVGAVPYITHEFFGNIRIDTIGAVNPHTFTFYHVLPE